MALPPKPSSVCGPEKEQVRNEKGRRAAARYHGYHLPYALVAQLAEVAVLEAAGCGFESRRGHQLAMNKNKLVTHVKLCRRNLMSSRVKCCAGCPFEDEITQEYPELKKLFEAKRKAKSVCRD